MAIHLIFRNKINSSKIKFTKIDRRNETFEYSYIG